MLPSKDLVVRIILFWILLSDAKCQNLDEMSKTLDDMLIDTRTFRRPRDYGDTQIWQEYEFGTGAGNREEVVVTNISTSNFNMPGNANQQFLQTRNAYYIAYMEHSILHIYGIHWDELITYYVTSIKIEGHILQYKLLELSVEEAGNEGDMINLLAVIVVENEYSQSLYWYRILGEKNLLYLKWYGVRHFRDMEFVQKENQRMILLLDDWFEDWTDSWINIYSFKVDPNRHSIDIWFCENLNVPKTLDIQVCPVYGNAVLSLQENGHIDVYKFEAKDRSCHFEKHDVIKTNNVTNFVCFGSGYIEYLAISGREPRLFHNFENEFQDNTDLRLKVAHEIFWITAVPLDTYRDDSLLLMQLANQTVIALTWQGSTFKQIPLPNEIMNSFDLSKSIVIPKIGFLHANTCVRMQTILKESVYPVYKKMESILKTQALLKEVFQKQEVIFDETEARLNQSHLIPTTTGSWNLSEVIVSNATFGKDVGYGHVTVGSVNLTVEDIATNVTLSLEKLKELETTLDQMFPNLTDALNITLPPNVELIGDFLVNGTLYAKKVTASAINNATASITIADDIVNNTGDMMIYGQKSFPFIRTDNFTIALLNGMPLEEIAFDASLRNYNDVDFAKLKRLEVQGHLNFSEINNVNWQNLMENIVWKDRRTVISGETTVDEIVAEDDVNVANLNHLSYPRDYVPADWINNKLEINVTGEKYFENLFVKDLMNVTTINDIDVRDFIILSRDETVDEGITFEDLEIEGSFVIDGNVTGIDLSRIEGLLNETNKLSSNIVFENLNIMGDIIFEESINNKTWSDFDDFLLKSDKSAIITGNKEFLNNVNVESNVTIELEEINGHAVSEFVTLDDNQQFSRLKKISASITFGNVTFGVMRKLKDYIIRESSLPFQCLYRTMVFNSSTPPLIDNLHFNTLMQDIPWATFFSKLNQSLQTVYFENLSLSELAAAEIWPKVINGIDYTDLARRMLTTSTKQTLTGDLVIDSLETEVLNAETINGIPLENLYQIFERVKSFHDNVFNVEPAIEIRSLRVLGSISVSLINDIDVLDIYEEDSMTTVIFRGDVSIENLTVTGFVNGFNLSEIADDSVRKTDRNVTFTGHKVFENFACEYLDARFVNDHYVGDILDANQEQTLKGPVTVIGSITVLREFNTTGKIGDVFLHDFTNRFQSLGNNFYNLHGDFYFTEITSIANLDVNGSIQESMFDDFLRMTISHNDANVTIYGSKLFDNSVTFDREFTIDGTLNDIELHKFHEGAVYIDKPLAINSDIVFTKDIHVQKDIVVKTKLQSSTIWGVDMKDLQESVIALDKIRYFPARMTLDNVTFRESVEVEQVNDLQMDLLITLHTKQFIPVDRLHCSNLTARNLQVLKHINTYTLDDIYENTFMINGNQNITGNVTIQENVYAFHDFNAHLINGFNPKHIVSLIANDTLTGNFMFKDPVVLNKSLRILGSLNGINPINWHGTAVKTIAKTKQIISGKWRVHGDVHFERDISGSEFLNGVNVTEMSTALARERAPINDIVGETYENLTNVCTSYLEPLMCDAAHQIYKFDKLDYLKVLEFKSNIHNVRKAELDNLDYIFVNYGTCRVKVLLYTEVGFKEVDEIYNVGLIDEWIFFNSKHSLYVLTVANYTCGSSISNVWKLENNKLTHVLALGDITNIINSNQDAFVGMIRESLEDVSRNMQSDITKAFASYEDQILDPISKHALADHSSIYNMQGKAHNIYQKDCVTCGSQLVLKVGIYNREEYLYYDENISQDYVYLYKTQKNISLAKISQTIKTSRPKSFVVLNLNGFVETLLIIAENNDTIQIYQYRGIEGFVHKDTIKMKLDKLYAFKIRTHTDLNERHCLAVIHENRLTVLEVKMLGEKLNLKTISYISAFCYPGTCVQKINEVGNENIART